MGFGFFGSVLLLSLFIGLFHCQDLNTDKFFLLDFFQKIGLNGTSTGIHVFSAHVCSWKGVLCDPEKEYVIGFVASGLNLSGVVPETTIGKLRKLQKLDLSNNGITALPSDLWSLTSLKTLNLSNNQISGSLPGNIGNFGLLQTLDISKNNFSGEIPAAVSSLGSLQFLKLDRNGFHGSIPTGILNCKSLVSIDLSSNRLNGSLPNGFSSAFPKLERLNLAENAIHGRPFGFSKLNSVTYLNISGNLFQGSVMDIFLQPVEIMDLSRNHFSGYISQVQFNNSYKWSRLVHMDLSENQLSGKIFHGLNYTPNLKYLNLAHNRFTPQEFPSIGTLSSLEYLNLSECSLTGDILLKIAQLGNLSTFDVSKNSLTGKIPWMSVEKLQTFDVSRNNLSGKIPLPLLNVSKVKRLNFSYNKLTLCAFEFSHRVPYNAIIGTINSCPVAANSSFFRRRHPEHKGLGLALALTLVLVCLLVGLLFLAFSFRKRTTKWGVKETFYKEEENISGPFSFQTDSTTWVADVKQANSVPVIIFDKPLLHFTFADLLSATSHFDRGTLLAEGRFGPVYRGFLPGGIHVAVKVLVHGSTLTDEEASKELGCLGRIKHPNLVPLTGYCLAGDQRMAIYEYMENGNLQSLLHDLPLGVQIKEDGDAETWEEDDLHGVHNFGSEGLLTTWRFRHKIALGTARALAFLHHGCSPPIIHRDVKASSVYLDSNLEPRLSDFGLAKIFGDGIEDEVSWGSKGYEPPEFVQPDGEWSSSPTPKSDVYAFGVVLFELVTGKKTVGDDYQERTEANLVSWLRGLVRRNEASRAIDPKIRGTGLDAQIEEALKIGYLCTADLPSKRPSMQQIVGLLKDIEPNPMK